MTVNAPFLPVLPAGDLESWLRNTCKLTNDSHKCSPVFGGARDVPVSVSNSQDGPQTAQLSDPIPYGVKGGRRQDMPVLRKVTDVNSIRNSFDFLSDPKAIDEAMSQFRGDFYAALSRKPRDAMLQTWARFHRRWYANDDIVPLTVESMEKVSCLFKLGAYKSYKNYLSRIKELHQESGYVWSHALQSSARRCTRSVLRGLGGPVRSEAFDLDRVVAFLKHSNIDIAEDGPESPLHAVVVGTYFLLRELELSAIDMEDVTFTNDTVTLNLPVSKVDWQAKGCRRTWSCICNLGHHCPVHLLKEYDHEQRTNGRTSGPWLLSRSGGRCTKAGMVDMIRTVVQSSGGGAKDAEGHWVISGHTFRITGARTLATWGLDPITIQLLGRWGSSAVLGYLAESPLLSFSERLTGKSDGKMIHAEHVMASDMDGRNITEAAQERESLRREIAELKKQVGDLTMSLDGVVQVVQSRQTREVWWVLNDTSKVLHSAVVDLSTTPRSWKTACGWKFTGQPLITTFREKPPGRTGRSCPKCLPDSDDSSSSSSESC